MNKRMLVVFVALALGVAAVPLFAQQDTASAPRTEPMPTRDRFRIELLGQANTTEFPTITVHFRVVNADDGQPARDMPHDDFVIYEDGKEVKRFPPAGLKSQQVVAVLALDTSGSMDRSTTRESQAKLQAAKDAASKFFDRLDPKIPCGLVLFHHQPYQYKEVTTYRDTLRKAIAATRAKGGTAYFDATSEAIRLLSSSAPTGQRAVVVMTDGRDVNSKRGLAEVVEEARRHKVRVYTVGLGEPGRNNPVRTVLVLDHSGSMQQEGRLEALKKAGTRFIEFIPPELADTSVIPFDDVVTNARPFSNNRPVLSQIVSRLALGGQTALYDATYDGIETLNAGRDSERGPTRRAVIVLTDGKDTSSHRRRDTDVIERAKIDGIKVYMLGLGSARDLNEPEMKRIAVETGGQYFRIEHPDQLTEVFEELSIRLHDDGIDEQSLQQLAEQTGGQYFHVQDSERLASYFELVATDLVTTYSVTFQSRRQRHDGTSRGIEIRLGEYAAARTGYTTHGLITPVGSPGVYGLLFLLLVGLLALPSLLRRLFSLSESEVA